MLLVFDIGNTNIVLGVYDGEELLRHWRISTDRQKTGDEYGMLINNLFSYGGLRIQDISAIIISSVMLCSNIDSLNSISGAKRNMLHPDQAPILQVPLNHPGDRTGTCSLPATCLTPQVSSSIPRGSLTQPR